MLDLLVLAPQQAFAGTSAYQTEVLADSPYVYYRFNETGGATTAVDTSGNNRAATYVDSPTQGVLGLGAGSDNAVAFDGVSQYVTSSPTMGFGSLMANSSYEFIFRVTNPFPASQMNLAGVFNDGTTTGMEISVNRNAAGSTLANSVRLFLRDDGGEGLGAAFLHDSILDGNYHHLLFTYDSAAGGDRIQAYVNGVPQAISYGTGTGSGATPTAFANFQYAPAFAGRQNRANNDLYFGGTLDELALYSMTLTPADALARATALGFDVSVPNQWNVNGGGSFNLAGNWSDGAVPTNDALFGSILSAANAPATVTLDSPVSLNKVSLSNSNQYILAGPSTLTLTGSREVSVLGTHQIAANVAGTGLVKTGTGTLVLPNAKSYTGVTSVQQGTLLLNNLDAIDNSASGTLEIAGGAVTQLSTGATGTLAAQLIGDGNLVLPAALDPADTITINRDNSAFNGLIRISDGTLVVSHANALGAGGTPANRTALDGNTTGRILLPGGITVADEVLDMDGRTTDAAHLTSTGTNAWNGVIDAQGNATLSRFNIESTSGTLTLNELYGADIDGPQTFVFSGAGNTTITGRLSEDSYGDATGVISASMFDNVGVVKRGSGNLTIAIGQGTATGGGGRLDYWFGPTVIEQGTLTVTDPIINDVGALRSMDITVRNGATFNVTAFTQYSLQAGNPGEPGQMLRGAGTVVANSLRLFDDNSVAPGDSIGGIGTLQVQGNMTLTSAAAPGEEGNWIFDIGNNSQPGNDSLVVSGTLTVTGSPVLRVNASPSHGHLDAGTYTIVTHASGTIPAFNSVIGRVSDANGNPLTTRQTVSVSGNTAGQIRLTITGEEATRTWNGNVAGGAWDVAATNNWQQGDQQYRDLDHVVFDDSATGTKTVGIDGPRHAGSVTFNNTTSAYQWTGEGGLSGTGGLTKMGAGLVELLNTGNQYSGDTVIQAGTLRIAAPFLADTADVYLSGGAILDLDFADAATDVINSLFLNGVQQAAGIWGAPGNAAANFTSSMLAGSGLLNVAVGAAGLPGDFNGNGAVENADLTLLLNNWGVAVPPTPTGWIGQPLTAPAVDNDELTALLNNWGVTSGAGEASAVPEPAAATLLAIAFVVAAASRRRRPKHGIPAVSS